LYLLRLIMDSETKIDGSKVSSKTDEILPAATSYEEAQNVIPKKDAIGEPLFSFFSKREKRWISYAASFAAMFSGLSGFIYYPTMVPLAIDLSVSVQLINLTVTSYLIIAGIAPAFMGDIADQTGRRPVYIITFVLMIAANVGLAMQKSYAALLVLRMLQSAGASSIGLISSFKIQY
jgi:nitrate/nitrite transporter NarK